MICRVVYILIMCHLSELGDAVKFLFVKKKTKRKKKKKFLLYFAIHRRNEGVVTYGIRAGSTRDLGFTTDVLITVGVLGVLHLTCVLGRL
jgi:hypothetical protein